MSTKYKVQFEGKEYTRTTANRTYTYLVLVRYSGAVEQCLGIERIRAEYPKLRAQHEEWARGGWEPAPWMYTDTKNPEGVVVIVGAQRVAEYREHGRKSGLDWLARYPTVQHQIDELVRDRAALGTDKDYIREAGWCGRLDLAIKLAASKRGHGIILDAVTGAVVRG